MAGVHSRFLKRNGGELVNRIDECNPPPEADRSFITELLILAATGKTAHFLDGRSLRHLEDRFAPGNLDTARPEDWRRRLSGFSTVVPEGPDQVARLLGILMERDDFPEVDAIKRWGIGSLMNLFADAGMDPRTANTVAALILRRERYAPGGPRYQLFYERLGLRTDGDGNLHRKALFPRHQHKLRWMAPEVVDSLCTPSTVPGGEVCEDCPIRRFCLAYRRATAGPGDPSEHTDLEFIDLFAGAGGMSLGLSAAGFRVRRAVEKSEKAVDTYLFNHPEFSRNQVLQGDVTDLVDDRGFIRRNRGVPLVAGGPPCQPFSMARRHSDADKDDPRRYLFRPFISLASSLEPNLVLMENVPGLLSANKRRIFDDLQDHFASEGFRTDHRLLYANEFGVPQKRRRVFVVAVNTDRAPSPDRVIERFWSELEAEREEGPSTGEALSGLPRLDPGEGGPVHRGGVPGRRSVYASRLGDGTSLHRNHEARPHNERDIEIFSKLREGERAIDLEERHHEEHGEGIIPYQLESFEDKYRRLEWDEPAPTIPAHLSNDANAFVHPKVPRGITCREAARLQSFPDDYFFLGGFGAAFRQVGNAVPPILAESVGIAARAVLKEPGYWDDG